MGSRAAWIFAIAAVYFGLFLPRPVTFLGGGWNEKSRLALTRAIVEHGTLTIDAYEKGTGDKARFGNHYYSDKAPGLSLVAVPVYAFIYVVERALGSHRLDAIDPMDVVNWWLVTLFVVSLPCAFGAVLFDRLCMKWTNDTDASLFATLALIFATPYSFYASVFVGHGVAATLSIAVFYVLFKDDPPTLRHFFIAGLLSGAGIVVDYPFALLAVVVLGYILLKRRKPQDAAVYILGMLPSLLILATYLTLAFGSPFRLGYTLEARSEFAAIHRAPLLGFSLPSLTAFLGITVSPFRGIFFFCPLLVLGVAGLCRGSGKGTQAVPRGLLWTLILGYLLANAAYPVWDGGDLPLARHSLMTVPFLAMGIALWRTGFYSVPARWLFLFSAFNVLALRLNMYHSVANYNPLFDLALPNLLSAEFLPTAGSLARLPGFAAVLLHLAASGGIVTLALRNLKGRTGSPPR
jgi:hypothetical protein